MKNWEEHLKTTLTEAARSSQLTAQDVIALIDLTLLDHQATVHDIATLSDKAQQHQVAAICIFPEHLPLLSHSGTVKRATVLNFPGGDQAQDKNLQCLDELIIQDQVDEIDYVFPYSLYLSGKQQLALSNCHQIYQRCKQQGITFKVIMETGAFPTMAAIYQASVDIINSGCDFLKTSTGKISQGASIHAAFAMLTAINDCARPCGIKLSGGIKTTAQAIDYIQLAEHMLNRSANAEWFRLGASGLLDDLIGSADKMQYVKQ